MTYKILILMLCVIFLVGNVSSQDFNFKQSVQQDVIIKCINVGVCSNSTVCNVTISDPNNIILVDNLQTTRSANGGFYNYTLNTTQLSELGEYKIGGFCKDGSLSKEVDFAILVTVGGIKITTAEALVYIVAFVGSLILFFLSLYFAITLPWVNRKIDDGAVSISKLKYLKLGLILLSFGLFNWILNLLLGLASFLSLDIFYGYFEFLFNVMVKSAWIIFVIWMVIFIITLRNDSKLVKLIRRGVFHS